MFGNDNAYKFFEILEIPTEVKVVDNAKIFRYNKLRRSIPRVAKYTESIRKMRNFVRIKASMFMSG